MTSHTSFVLKESSSSSILQYRTAWGGKQLPAGKLPAGLATHHGAAERLRAACPAWPRAPALRPRRAARTRRHDDNQPTMLAFRRLLAFRRGHDQTQTHPRQVSQTHTGGPEAGLPLWPCGGRAGAIPGHVAHARERHRPVVVRSPDLCTAPRKRNTPLAGDGPGSACGRAAGGWGCGRMRGRCVAVGSCWASLRLLPAPLSLAPIACLSTPSPPPQITHNLYRTST